YSRISVPRLTLVLIWSRVTRAFRSSAAVTTPLALVANRAIRGATFRTFGCITPISRERGEVRPPRNRVGSRPHEGKETPLALQLGDTAPDFEAETTEGTI